MIAIIMKPVAFCNFQGYIKSHKSLPDGINQIHALIFGSFYERKLLRNMTNQFIMLDGII
jgi:hypothetical protein